MIKATVYGSGSRFLVEKNLAGSKAFSFATAEEAIAFADSLFKSREVSSYGVYIDGYTIGGEKEAE